jgi:dUTP pyrophosphatase
MNKMSYYLQPLQVQKLHADAKIPTRATTYDAGYDLYALESGQIESNDMAIIRTGIAVRLPQLQYPFRVYGSMRARSGLSAKNCLEVGAGVVDLGYSGEIKVILHNHSKSTIFRYNAGDRIAQLVLEVHVTPEVVEVDELPPLKDNDRRDGFGSTGI